MPAREIIIRHARPEDFEKVMDFNRKNNINYSGDFVRERLSGNLGRTILAVRQGEAGEEIVGYSVVKPRGWMERQSDTPLVQNIKKHLEEGQELKKVGYIEGVYSTPELGSQIKQMLFANAVNHLKEEGFNTVITHIRNFDKDFYENVLSKTVVPFEKIIERTDDPYVDTYEDGSTKKWPKYEVHIDPSKMYTKEQLDEMRQKRGEITGDFKLPGPGSDAFSWSMRFEHMGGTGGRSELDGNPAAWKLNDAGEEGHKVKALYPDGTIDYAHVMLSPKQKSRLDAFAEEAEPGDILYDNWGNTKKGIFIKHLNGEVFYCPRFEENDKVMTYLNKIHDPDHFRAWEELKERLPGHQVKINGVTYIKDITKNARVKPAGQWEAERELEKQQATMKVGEQGKVAWDMPTHEYEGRKYVKYLDGRVYRKEVLDGLKELFTNVPDLTLTPLKMTIKGKQIPVDDE